jgi:phosphatidylinositol dimannoside acyltransferase
VSRLVEWAYAAGWACTRLVPEWLARAVFALLADLLWFRHGRGVRRLEANLSQACPDLDSAALRALSRRAMRSYLRYWCEAFRLPEWDDDEIVSRVVVEDEHVLRDAYAAGHGVVVALPHTANWDHAGAWACRTGMPVTTVAERLRPATLFDRFVAYRQKLGMEVLPLGGAEQSTFATLVRRARAGGLICLVADRDLSSTGVEVELLGAHAMLPVGPATLARATGATLLPATLSYTGRHLRVRIHPAVPPVSGRDGTRKMTQQVADAFSEGIRAHPEDWHMLQRLFVTPRGSR